MKTGTMDFYRCRDLGHHWEEDHFPIKHQGRRVAWGKRRVLLCTSCGAEQLQLINIHGKVDSRHYDMPDGYKEVTRGKTRTEARAERIRLIKKGRKS